MSLHSVEIKDLAPEMFRIFGTQNALLTAGSRERCNTMTVGWSQIGVLWGVPVCTVYVRPERYTYAFTEESDYFTVSVLPEKFRKTMAICGTKSGRDMDKIAECGLTLCYGEGDAPYFAESELVLVCKKLYAQDMDASCVTEEATVSPYYKTGGWHRTYVGKIVEAYMK